MQISIFVDLLYLKLYVKKDRPRRLKCDVAEGISLQAICQGALAL